MLLVRRVRIDRPHDLKSLERRLGGRRLDLQLGESVCLLTGCTERPAFEVDAFGLDAAVVREERRLPVELRSMLTARPTPVLRLGSSEWVLGSRVRIIGVVNVTPDSFSDGGRFSSPQAAVEHGIRLVEEGADALDVGGESTRPGSTGVSLEDELRRVIPVIEALSQRLPGTPLSIDTSKPDVAHRALESGAVMVNDVTGMTDPRMAEVALAGHATVCAMHMQGTVQTMQRDPRYRDVVHEVGEWFAETIHRCVGLGLARDRLIVDPGIGFGKTLEHNLMLLRQLDAFRFLKVPVMLGTSRKSFLGAITHESVASARVVSSAVSISLAAATGAVDMVRVHDVRQTKEALLVAEAIGSASAGGERWICAEPTLEKSTGAL